MSDRLRAAGGIVLRDGKTRAVRLTDTGLEELPRTLGVQVPA